MRAFFLLLVLLSFPNTVFADISGRVVAVVDGDSITVLAGGKSYKVRLAEIDAPEKGQAYYRESKKYLSGLVFGKEVSVANIVKDKYGRDIGDVTRSDGLRVSREMVRRGYAWWYEYFYPDDIELKELQNNARKGKLDLWAGSDPINPREFRVKARRQTSAASQVKKSRRNICHVPGSRYYEDVQKYSLFKSLEKCLASGGRMPADS